MARAPPAACSPGPVPAVRHRGGEPLEYRRDGSPGASPSTCRPLRPRRSWVPRRAVRHPLSGRGTPPAARRPGDPRYERSSSAGPWWPSSRPSAPTTRCCCCWRICTGEIRSPSVMEEALGELADEPASWCWRWPGPRWSNSSRPLGPAAPAGAPARAEPQGRRPAGPRGAGRRGRRRPVERLVEQAAGNALFLEELIRAVAEGRGEAPPETVLAMLQARLMRLEPEARRVLLAASFFGRTFWAGGVRALRVVELSPRRLKHRLQALVELEWVEPQPTSRFPARGRVPLPPRAGAGCGLRAGARQPQACRPPPGGVWLEQAVRATRRCSPSTPRWASSPSGPSISTPGPPSSSSSAMTCRARSGAWRPPWPWVPGRGPGAVARAPGHRGLLDGGRRKLFEIGPGVLTELRPGCRLWCWLVSGLYMGHARGRAGAGSGTRTGAAAHPSRADGTDALPGSALLHAEPSASRQESSAYLTRLLELCAESRPRLPLSEPGATSPRALLPPSSRPGRGRPALGWSRAVTGFSRWAWNGARQGGKSCGPRCWRRWGTGPGLKPCCERAWPRPSG